MKAATHVAASRSIRLWELRPYKLIGWNLGSQHYKRTVGDAEQDNNTFPMEIYSYQKYERLNCQWSRPGHG